MISFYIELADILKPSFGGMDKFWERFLTLLSKLVFYRALLVGDELGKKKV